MKCPVCIDEKLVMTDRQGVEIDYCPRCRGVWLDRGELDKIIDRSSAEVPQAQTYGRNQHTSSRSHGHPKKQHSVLRELFDF